MNALLICGQTTVAAERSVHRPTFDVTDAGAIVSSEDGVHWTMFDFNTFYQGYYKPCRFTCILATPRRIAAAGVDCDGTPVLYLSAEGKVWTPRSLDYTNDNGERAYLQTIPHTITYDARRDLLILECENGYMYIPSCSHCNEWREKER